MNIIIIFLYELAAVIWIGGLVVAGLLLLRMLVHWLNLSPFSWLPYNLRRITEPILRPIRGSVGPILPYDMIPLVMAIFVATTGLFAASILQAAAGILHDAQRLTPTVRDYARYLIELLIFAYTVLLFLRIVFSLFQISYYGKFARFTYQVTEPILRPLRRYLIIGMFDLSIMVAIVLVQILGRFLISLIS